jgi:predicted amidophosphoribosyltransferase
MKTGFNVLFLWYLCNVIDNLILYWGQTWSWSYGSRIYNYLCNQCLSPLTLWVWTLFMMRCTWYNIMWWSLSVTCDSGIKHHKSNQNLKLYWCTFDIIKSLVILASIAKFQNDKSLQRVIYKGLKTKFSATRFVYVLTCEMFHSVSVKIKV